MLEEAQTLEEKNSIGNLINKVYYINEEMACIMLHALNAKYGYRNLNFNMNANPRSLDNIPVMQNIGIQGEMTIEQVVEHLGIEVPLRNKTIRVVEDPVFGQRIIERETISIDCPHIGTSRENIILDSGGHRICRECVIICSRCGRVACRKCTKGYIDRESGEITMALCRHHSKWTKLWF